jgi:molybdopterin-guanine dinucleotide biosynthesis protein A
MPRATAAILAGGHARRFGGRDKTQLRVDGRTILDRQCAALDRIGDRILLVGYRGPMPRIDPGRPDTVPRVVVPDRVDDRGPLGGLDAALAAAPDSAVLLLACDLPHVTRDLLEFLVAQLNAVDAVVPRTERGYHPLCAVYAQTCRTAVERRLQQGQLRMIDLLDDLRLRVVAPRELAAFGDPGHLLANLNSQADLDAAESVRNH